MLNLFKQAGFNYQILKKEKFKKLPLKRRLMNKKFSNLSEEDLLVSDFHILLFPNKIT